MRVDWPVFIRRVSILAVLCGVGFYTGKALVSARRIKAKADRMELRVLYLEAERERLFEQWRRLRTLDGRLRMVRKAGYFDPRRGERVVRFVEVPLPEGVRSGWRGKGR